MAAITTTPVTRNQINNVIEDLRTNENHNYLAITLLMLKATRIGDILNTIKLKDVFTQSGSLRSKISYEEEKTGKRRVIVISDSNLLMEALENVWIENKLDERDYETSGIFYSRKARGKYKNSTISNINVNRVLNRYVGKWGIEQLTTHSIRKTAGMLMLEAGHSTEIISRVYNHSSTAVTRLYLMINEKEVQDAMSCLAI
jgi:integrase